MHDAMGKVATGYSGTATITLLSPDGGVLTGTTTTPFIQGQAQFSNLTITQPGLGNVLQITANDLTIPGITSAPFDVLPAGNYLRMALRSDTASPKTLILHLDITNFTGKILPAGTALSFAFHHIAFDPKAIALSSITDATWKHLTTESGIALLTTHLFKVIPATSRYTSH